MRSTEFLESQYLSKIKELHENCSLLIYGAGIYGKNLLHFLTEKQIKISGFAVSDEKWNPANIVGLPVKAIDRWLQDEKTDYAVLIGALAQAGKQMTETVIERGIKHCIQMPEDFDLVLDDCYKKPVLEITPLAGCRVNCRFCPQKVFMKEYFSRTRKREISFSDFKICLDKTPKDLIVDFSGFVEPFFAEDILKMIRYCSDTGHLMRLFTTLRDLNAERYRQIEDIEFKTVVLHLPDKRNYANIPITQEYLEMLEIFASRNKANGESFVDLANCQAEPREEVVKIINRRFPISWKLGDRAGNLDSAEEIETTGYKQGRLFCERAEKLNHNVLLPNGDVVLCCMDFGLRHRLGNLLEDSYENLFSGEEYKAVADAMMGTEDCLCRRCGSSRVWRDDI